MTFQAAGEYEPEMLDYGLAAVAAQKTAGDLA